MRFRRGRPIGHMRSSIERGDPRKFRIYGLVLWLWASRGITLTGADVSTFADQSGAGNDFTAAANRPLYEAAGMGGRPSVRFDAGASERMRGDTLAASFDGADTPIFAIGTVHVIDVARDGVLLGLSEPTTIAQMMLRVSTAGSKLGAFRRDDAASAVTVATTQASTTDVRVVRFSFTGTALSIHINSAATSVAATAMNVGAASFTEAAIGAGPAPSEISDMRMGDLIVFTSIPPEDVSRRIEKRSAALYGAV